MEILSTKEYSIFKFYPNNRPISSANLHRLIKSIEEKNLTHINPIICSEEMVVIDGQHRLKACEQLGVPVHYIVTNEDTANAIELLNAAQEKWKLGDFMTFFGILPNVRFFKEMNGKYEISLPSLFAIFRKDGVTPTLSRPFRARGSRTMAEVFKKGLPLNYSHEVIEEFCSYLHELIDYFPVNESQKKRFYTGSFPLSIWRFVRCQSVDKELLKKRLWEAFLTIAPSRGALEIRKMIATIYNKGLRTKKIKLSKSYMPLEAGEPIIEEE